MTKEFERLRNSMVNVTIGGRTFPVKTSNRCKVCQHPARALIEERLMIGEQVTAIIRWVSEQEYEEIDGARIRWPLLEAHHLRNHIKADHCPLDTKVLHEIVSQREEELKVQYDGTVTRVADHVIFTKMLLHKGQERLLNGQLQPDLKETLAAAKMLADIEYNSGGEDPNASGIHDYAEAMAVYFDVVRATVTPEQWEQIRSKLTTNPVLKAIAARQAQQDEIVDADLVETEGAPAR